MNRVLLQQLNKLSCQIHNTLCKVYTMKTGIDYAHDCWNKVNAQNVIIRKATHVLIRHVYIYFIQNPITVFTLRLRDFYKFYK
jgi:hypothetical protein